MTRPDIAFHSFLARHTPESRFTHWTLTEAEVLDRVQKNWNARRPSYRDGVLEVPVEPEGFFSPVVFLQPGDRLKGVYESRKEGEEPRMVTVLDRGTREKTPAVGVNVILYHKNVLAEDGETFDHDWAIISINARITEEPEPMTVGTLMANHFHIDGGTATGWSPEKFEEELRKSFLYWRNKALLG